MKSKALFILPAHNQDHDSWKNPAWNHGRIPPISLISIMSYLQSKGHETKLVDSRQLIFYYKTNDYLPIVGKIVRDFNPDVVGISMLTALFDETKEITEHLKKEFPHIPIIAGGPHPSIEPLLTFEQNKYLDAICVGPGEEVCLDILEGRKMGEIPGLMVRGTFETYKKRDVELNIDKYPFPDYHLVSHSFYSAYSTATTFGWLTRSLTVLTSRSCPYSCKFCASDWSKPVRYHSADYVIELGKYLSTFDITTIVFLDDTIALKENRLMKICEGFIRSKLFLPHGRLRWYTQLRANQAKPGLLKMMKAAGCFYVGIGIESGSDQTLKSLNKKTTVEQNRQACAYIKEAGLDLGASFMCGVPGETEEEIRKTFSFMQEINTNSKGFGCFRPLPGSPFYYELLEKGLLKKEEIDWSNLGNFSIPPKDAFCNIERDKLVKLINEGSKLAYASQWVAVHEDTAEQCPALLKEVSRYREVRISSLSNFNSETHRKYVNTENNELALVITKLNRLRAKLDRFKVKLARLNK